MKKQTSDLIQITLKFSLIMTGATALMGACLYLIDHNVGLARLTCEEVALVYVILPFSFACIAFSVLMIFTTRKRKHDPFRFSRQLKAYFEIPFQDLALKSQINLRLRSAFSNVNEISSAETTALWSSVQESAETSNARHKPKQELRLVRMIFLRTENENKKLKILVLIQPSSRLRIADTNNANTIALEDLLKALEWRQYQTKVDDNGNPIWNSI